MIKLVHKFEDIISAENILSAWQEFFCGKRSCPAAQKRIKNSITNKAEHFYQASWHFFRKHCQVFVLFFSRYVPMAREKLVPFFYSHFGLFFYLLIVSILLVLNSKDSTIRLMALILSAILCGYAVQSFFDFPKERITHNMVRLVIFAAIIKLVNYENKSENGKRFKFLSLIKVF